MAEVTDLVYPLGMKYQRISQTADEQEFLNSPAGHLLAGPTPTLTADDVAHRAFSIFLREGSRPGQDVQHWLRAEAELTAEHQAAQKHLQLEPSSDRKNNQPMHTPPTTPAAPTSGTKTDKSTPVTLHVKLTASTTSAASSPANPRSQTVTTPQTVRDLSKQAPHSPRERLSDFVLACRAVDKCRASIAGTLGEYHYDCPMDKMLFAFKGITGEEFKSAVQAAKTTEQVGAWLLANGTSKTPAEIKAWSDKVEQSRLSEDPAKRAFFEESCTKLGLDPKKATTFDWLEADDRASFGNKCGCA